MTAQLPPGEAIEWVKTATQLFAPFLALGGAIWLYFKKARDDRIAAARQSRGRLYEEYIDKISNVLAVSEQLSVAATAVKIALELAPVHSKISVLAPRFIVEESHKYIESLVTIKGTSYWRPPADVTDMVEKLAHIEMNRQIGNSRQNLINAFRRDIYPHAEPLPKEMAVASRPEDSVLNQFAVAVERAIKDMQK